MKDAWGKIVAAWGKAWPVVSGAYSTHELVRHAVTALVVAFVVKVFW